MLSVASPGALIVLLAYWCAEPASASAGFLFVWAGASDGSKANDSLFVVDVGVASNTFGRIVGRASTPYSGTEPHHMTVSHDGKTVMAGGLLSVLSGKPNWWHMDVRKPTSPTIIAGIEQPKYGSCPDEVLALPNGDFVATMMGSSSGATPGTLVVYSKKGKVKSQYPSSATANGFAGFNPHGLALDTMRGTAVSTDFMEPASTLNAVPGPLVVRTTLRLWTYNTTTNSRFKVVKVLDVRKFNDAGLADTKLIPQTGAYWLSSWSGVLYYVDPAQPTTSLKILFSRKAPNGGPQASMLATFRNATRLVMTCYSTSSVLLFDTTRPDKPKKLQELFLPGGKGAHHMVVNKEETLVSVATYFLDEGTFGKVHMPGDKGVHLLNINANATRLSSRKFLNFQTLLGKSGGFNPHSTGFSF